MSDLCLHALQEYGRGGTIPVNRMQVRLNVADNGGILGAFIVHDAFQRSVGPEE